MDAITSTAVLAAFCERAAALRFRHRRHRVPARNHVLAEALPAPGGDHRRGGARRPAGAGPRPRAVLRPSRQREGDQGLPRRPAGHRNLRQAHRPRAEEHLRHPGRGQRLRLWRQRQLRQPRPRRGRHRSRQVLPLHRLVAPAADRKAEDLRAGRRHPPPRHLLRPAESRWTRPTAGTGSRTRWRSSARSTPTSSSPSRPGNG